LKTPAKYWERCDRSKDVLDGLVIQWQLLASALPIGIGEPNAAIGNPRLLHSEGNRLDDALEATLRLSVEKLANRWSPFRLHRHLSPSLCKLAAVCFVPQRQQGTCGKPHDWAGMDNSKVSE
jgi:hypothetical protein